MFHDFFYNIVLYLIEYFATSTNKNIPAKFGLENLLDEKDIFPYLHREMFGGHGANIYPSWVFTSVFFASPLTLEEREAVVATARTKPSSAIEIQL